MTTHKLDLGCPRCIDRQYPGRSPGLSQGPLPPPAFSPCMSQPQSTDLERSIIQPGPHWHTRDLMTSPGPCKSKTGDPTSSSSPGPLAGGGGESTFGAGATPRCSPPRQANGRQPQARGLPKAVVQRGATAFRTAKTGCPGHLEEEWQGKVQASSRCQSLPQLEEQHSCCRLAVALVLEPHLCFLLARLFVTSLILPYFSRSNRGYVPSPKTCLVEIVKLVMRVSPSILHGLWGPLHRMADASRSLPRSCFSRPSTTFPFCLCHRDLPSPLLLLLLKSGLP